MILSLKLLPVQVVVEVVVVAEMEVEEKIGVMMKEVMTKKEGVAMEPL
jgi:hypothetical protein